MTASKNKKKYPERGVYQGRDQGTRERWRPDGERGYGSARGHSFTWRRQAHAHRVLSVVLGHGVHVKLPSPARIKDLAPCVSVSISGDSLASAPRFSKSGAPASKALLSLDVLRGITIAFMIMVNNSGDGAWAQMHHAAWNGLTATDLVFPTFLFVVGVSIVFSTEARLRARRSRSQARRARGDCARSFCLRSEFLSTAFLTSISSTCVFTAFCSASPSAILSWRSFICGIGAHGQRLLLLVWLLVGYWALVRWVPVPGAGVPGRDVPLLDKNQNIVAWLDRQLMPGHLYEDSPLHNARDPEGLLSDIPRNRDDAAGSA